MINIEQQRRDFMVERRELYDYITHFEGAKILDSAGDMASGASDAAGAANRIWAASGRHRRAAEIQRGEKV